MHSGWFVLMLLALLVVLGILFHGSFRSGHILFSKDTPLGYLMSECHRLPDRFIGCWQDLNLIGYAEGYTMGGISFALGTLLKPLWFAKFYAPLGILILGLGAWLFFRQMGLAPAACLLGGLAAALNSGFFSVACWGVVQHTLAVGMTFMALAVLGDSSSRQGWLRVVLAGFAVGMGIAEGMDLGGLFSLLVAAFVLYQAWIAEGPRAKNVAAGVTRLALAALCALLVAAHPIWVMIANNVKGVAGAGQDAISKAERWDFATQWSLPKSEILSLIVPGLFGYRADSPAGGNYWGAVGRSGAWDKYLADGSQGPPPEGWIRYSGGGSYAGVLVVVLAFWAGAQSLRRNHSVFSFRQRCWLWFWIGVSVLSLPLALGKYAPFYKLLYALPYVSTVRNPVKLLYLVSFALVVLFAYGIDGLWRAYLRPVGSGAEQKWGGLRSWWSRATPFEKGCVHACWLTLGLSVLAWAAYALSRQSLEQHLHTVQFKDPLAGTIAAFSIHQAGCFVLLFALSAVLVASILSGFFAGPRAKWCGAWLGLLLIIDLGRANQPWIVYWDFNSKYASNPVVEELRQRPYEHRVAILPFGSRSPPPRFETLYQREWLQHLFPYYSIQSLDLVQLPRVPEDIAAFGQAFSPSAGGTDWLKKTRWWQLTNTRYLLGPATFFNFIAQRDDPAVRSFRIIRRFNLVPKPGIAVVADESEATAAPDTNGTFAVFEFTAALPRARLYSSWQVNTNGPATLSLLTSAAFDPQQTVLVASPLPAPPAAPAGGQSPGTVEFSRYKPTDIVLKTTAAASTVLLLNDRLDPNWEVLVDARPAPLLRCNYLMRGVYLPHGAHTVEFRYRPPRGLLYVSLAAIGLGLIVLGFVALAPGFASTFRRP